MSFDSLSHDRKTAMPALAVSIEVVTTVLLWMRVGSRFSTAHSTIGIDDILIFAAWVTGLGLTVAVLLGMLDLSLPSRPYSHKHRYREIWAQSSHLGCAASILLQGRTGEVASWPLL